MPLRSLRFALFLVAAAVVSAGCGGGGAVLPGTGATITSPLSSTSGAKSKTRSIASGPAGTYWSGTVSDISGSGITANCGQSNFAAGYGCMPVTTTGATTTGTPVVGGYFQLWGDLSQLPNITATTINFATTPYPATAPSSASAGASLSSSTFMGFANAADYPTSFTPFASTSVWRTPISSHPTIAWYSAAVVAVQFPNGLNNRPVRATEAGKWDYSHPRFFASASDPLVNVQCTQYCGSPENGGAPSQIYIPAKARSAGGSDSHLDVVQPDGTDISMWATTANASDWTPNSTLRAGVIANCGSFASGQGWLATGPGPTAAGYCDNAGIVTAAELLAGQINHALFIVGECGVGNQYPVEYGGTTGTCTSGVGPPLGGREWYDVPCATTQGNGSLQPWEKAILCALNQYGAFMGDNEGGGSRFTGGVSPQLESEEPWYDFFGAGYTSPFAALASQGWTSFSMSNVRSGAAGIRWIGNTGDAWQPAGVDFAAHIHWLDACSAQGAC